MPVRKLIAVGALCLTAGAAMAHAKKETTHPADGALLAQAPETIAMSFDSPIMITMFRIKLADGEELPFEGGVMTPVTEYEVVPSGMSAGDYSVEWRGLSEDGHPVEGTFSFRVE